MEGDGERKRCRQLRKGEPKGFARQRKKKPIKKTGTVWNRRRSSISTTGRRKRDGKKKNEKNAKHPKERKIRQGEIGERKAGKRRVTLKIAEWKT